MFNDQINAHFETKLIFSSSTLNLNCVFTIFTFGFHIRIMSHVIKEQGKFKYLDEAIKNTKKDEKENKIKIDFLE